MKTAIVLAFINFLNLLGTLFGHREVNYLEATYLLCILIICHLLYTAEERVSMLVLKLKEKK